jgi:hypothetical protein
VYKFENENVTLVVGLTQLSAKELVLRVTTVMNMAVFIASIRMSGKP